MCILSELVLTDCVLSNLTTVEWVTVYITMTECFDFSTLIVLPYDLEKERQFQISNSTVKFSWAWRLSSIPKVISLCCNNICNFEHSQSCFLECLNFDISDSKSLTSYSETLLTLFPLEGGHCASLHIQIISFQVRMELDGWKLDNNIISNILHIWEVRVLYFIVKNLKKI